MKKLLRFFFKSYVDRFLRLEHSVQRIQEERRQPDANPKDGRQVDLVNLGPVKIFIYMDDLAYKAWTPEECKNYQLTSDDITRCNSNTNSTKSDFSIDIYPIDRVCEHYWREDLQFTMLDIGCQYGVSSILFAQYIASRGKDNKIISFEPGRVNQLVPYNIALNGFKDKIHMEPLAVSESTHPLLLYSQIGHSENNRITERHSTPNSFSYVVQAMSIDDYARKEGLKHHFIAKIDTEGAEPAVLAGMSEVLKDRFVSIAMEYTPWAISSKIAPVKFLADLSKNAYLFDIGQMHLFFARKSQPNKRCRLINDSSLEKFTREVSESKYAFTDLLLVPKTLPNVDMLIKELTQSAVD